MIPLTLAEMAEVTGGRLHGVPDPDLAVTGPVVVDSREVLPGAVFAALPGDRTDGRAFAGEALDRGAVLVLADRPLQVPTLVCPDVVAALGALAAAVLARLPGLLVVAVTGSAGKTSTKDLLAQVLAVAGPTVAPVGSYNNEIGVPLTAMRAEESTRHLVLEMGARGLGHIAYLARMTSPQVGVVLNVGTAHASEFGDLDVTARAKGELVEALPADGVAVLNADDERVRAMAARTSARVVLTGRSLQAQVRATDVRLDERARACFTLSVDPQAPGKRPSSGRVQLQLHGEHQVSNALAVAAVALSAGMELEAVARALSAATAGSRWRMEVTQRPDGVTVVNDAYNANPESMRAALKALVAMSGGRRTWAVLGEMLELGAGSVAEHDALGRLAVRLNVSRLVAVGEGAHAVHTGAVQEGSWGQESVFVPDIDAAESLLAEELRPGDVVLVKSSNAAGLRWLGDRLAGLEVPPR